MRRIGFVALAASLLTGCLDWTQSGGNAGRTNTVAEGTLTPATVAGLSELWVAPATSGRVVTWEDRVVVAGPGGSAGVDTGTGDVAWTGTWADRDVVVRDGVAFLASYRTWPGCERPGCLPPGSEASITALDVADGAPRPERSRQWPDGSMTGPSTMGGMATADHEAWVVLWTGYEPNGVSHATMWVEVDGQQVGPQRQDTHGYATMDAAAERLYVSALPWGQPMRHEAWSLDGTLLWQRDASVGGPVKAVAGQVFTGLEVLDGATGEELWRPEAPGLAGSAFTPTTLYTVDVGGEVRAYDACGETVCPATWTGTGAGLSQTIAVAGDVVYVASNVGPDVQLRAYDADGCGAADCAPLVTRTLTGQLDGDSRLAVTRGQVYVSTTSGLHAFGLP